MTRIREANPFENAFGVVGSMSEGGLGASSSSAGGETANVISAGGRA